MEIIWYGQSFFELKAKNSKEPVYIVIDPVDAKLGLKIPKLEPQILLVTHSENVNPKSVKGEFLIDEQGEYEIKGVFIKAIACFHEKQKNVIYKLEVDGMKVCHLGDFKQKELDEKQLEEIGEVDILMIPVGTIEAKTATSIISQIEPRIVIPMMYKVDKLKIKIDDAKQFLKTMGAEGTEPEKKLKVRIKDLPTEETKIIVLENA